MRVLVTGGTGYVGRFIVEAMLREGFEVIVAGRQPPRSDLFSAPVAFRPLDLDPDTDQTALLEGVDWMVHCAFDHVAGKYRGGEGDDPTRFIRLNREGSIALFEAAKAQVVRRALFLSSRAVYGPQGRPTVLTEETPAKPDTLYGQVKLDVERALSDLASEDFVATSLRVTGVYGAHCAGADHKWQRLFADFLAGRSIAPRIATEVHGDDVAQAALLLPSICRTSFSTNAIYSLAWPRCSMFQSNCRRPAIRQAWMSWIARQSRGLDGGRVVWQSSIPFFRTFCGSSEPAVPCQASSAFFSFSAQSLPASPPQRSQAT
jgi:UDP-glucose 4-epimerase